MEQLKSRYKLHDTEFGTCVEINKTLAISLIHDQYPNSFDVYLNQLYTGTVRCVSVRGGIVEKF